MWLVFPAFVEQQWQWWLERNVVDLSGAAQGKLGNGSWQHLDRSFPTGAHQHFPILTAPIESSVNIHTSDETHRSVISYRCNP